MNVLLSHIKKRRIMYSYVLTLILICAFVIYLVRHKEIFNYLTEVPFEYIIWITVLALLYKIVLGLKFKIMINFFGIKLKLREWLGLSCVVSMINSLFPVHAGATTQAVYLKKVYKFEYSKFLSYMLNFLIFSVLVYSSCGILFLILYYMSHHVLFTPIFLVFLLLFFVCLILIFLIPKFVMMGFKWALLNKVISGFRALNIKRSLLLRFVAVQVVDIIITGLRLFLAYRALGAKVGILPIMIVGLIASLSSILNLTPASLGIRELFITISSVLVGEGIMFGVMASVIDRIIGTLITFIFGLIAMYVLLPTTKMTLDK